MAEAGVDEEPQRPQAARRQSQRFAAQEIDIEDEVLAAAESASQRSCLRRCIASAFSPPKMEVYVPKGVNFENPKVQIVYFLLCVVVVVLSATYFSGVDKYSVEVTPDIQVSTCGRRCHLLPSVMDAITDKALAKDYCSSSATYVNSATTYTIFSCLQRCGRSSTASSCVEPSELVQTGHEEAFIPTFMRETFYTPATGSSCPAGYQLQSGTPTNCIRTRDYYVAGAEDWKLTFNHQFSVQPFHNSLSFSEPAKALKAHSSAVHSEGWDEGLLTVLVDHRGQEIQRFLAGSAIELTAADLLKAAYYDERGETPLSLDDKYQSTNFDIRMMPTRLTGVSLTIDVWMSDDGECQIKLHEDSQQVVRARFPSNGPLACLSVRADRRWSTETTEQPVGVDGSVRIREKNGIKVKFRKMGSFRFVSEQAIIRNLTVVFLWLQLPLVIVYWFCSTCLGKLSEIYYAILHQQVNVAESCKGFAVRLLTYSSSFMGLRSKMMETGSGQGPDGITKKVITERVGKLCEGFEINEDAMSKVVDLLFNNIKSYKKDNAPNSKVITCQEFCAACSANEQLTLETLVKIFDKDRKLGLLESIFLDKDLAKVRQAAEMDTGASMEMAFDVKAMGKEVDGDAAHSKVVQAYKDVQFMLNDLRRIEQLALETAKDLDVNPRVLGLVGKSATADKTTVGVPQGPVLPKLKRDVSSDSIGDEGNPEKRDYRDIER
eukprot:TRINITY_DN8210_c0_g1_i1.p1 TRINITY_DN8210_c0_g1~~TRINITY_DN8210_c0_g1_i1.p1  ORF type:complete len:717 (-),score=165.64 TRINITY_DN8210_c0_g1_i1:78-2228(-)